MRGVAYVDGLMGCLLACWTGNGDMILVLQS